MGKLYAFDGDLAEKVGVNAAIVFAQVEHWVNWNRIKERNLREGKYWCYNSVREWKKYFPFLSEKQIRTALETLLNEGYLISGNFNTKGYDRTKWYTVSERGAAFSKICPQGQRSAIEGKSSAIEGKSSVLEGKPIPENNTTKENTKKIASPTEMCGAEAPLYSDPLVNLDESRIF